MVEPTKVLAWIGVAVLVAPVGLVAWRSTLNVYGYCRAEQRFLSDQELIHNAVEHIVVTYPPIVDLYELENGQKTLVGRSTPTDPIPYKDLDDFFRVNANCCEVRWFGAKGYVAPWFYRIRGGAAKFVWVRYLVRYRDSDGDVIEVPELTTPAMRNCGEPWSGI